MCPSNRHPLREMADGKPDFRTAFDVLDSDRDGKISPEDLRAFYSGLLGSEATREEIETMMAAADANKDGFVEYEEFERVLLGRQGSSSSSSVQRKGVVDEMFQVMDKDGDGRVGFDDLKSYMAWAGFPASDDQIRAMIRMGGGDDQQGVCCESLMKFLAVDLF